MSPPRSAWGSTWNGGSRSGHPASREGSSACTSERSAAFRPGPFASTIEVLDLFLDNGGKGELEVLGLTSSETWLSVAPAEVDDNGLGVYRISVDRSDLQAGTYDGAISAASTANPLTVRVLMSVGGEDVTAPPANPAASSRQMSTPEWMPPNWIENTLIGR